ncbi:hypothetical protein D3C72_1426760 [compost metagenome]
MRFCNLFTSDPIISQSLFLFDSFKLLFAFIIAFINPSTSSVLFKSISTASCDNRLIIASFKSSPIASLLPDETITFFSCGTNDSFNIVW